MIVPEHLADLHRDRRGLPVTYTAAWSSEKEMGTSPDAHLGGLLAYSSLSGTRGGGSPHPGVTSLERVRESIVRGLCQVCAKVLPAGPRHAADLRDPMGATSVVNGVEHPQLIDGWTCMLCLPYSKSVCPALLRDRPTWLEIGEWVLIAATEVPASGFPCEKGPEGTISFVHIVPTNWRVLDVAPPEEGQVNGGRSA